MKIIGKIVAAILFILFFGFALKNSHEVTLRFFLGQEWHTPLSLLLLASVLAGALLGILAMTPTVFRKRRELNRNKSTIEALQKERDAQQAARTQSPRPDGIAQN